MSNKPPVIPLSTPRTFDQFVPDRDAEGLPEPVGLWVGAGSFSQLNPTVVALAAEIMATWSYVEAGVVEVAQTFLDGGLAATTAILTRITDRHRLRSALMAAARAQGLPEPQAQLMGRTLKAVNQVGVRRNMYAHWLWAAALHLPDSLLFVPPEHATHVAARNESVRRDRRTWAALLERLWISAELGSTEMAPPPVAISFTDWARILVFEEADLRTDIAAMRRAQELVHLLSIALSDGPHHADARTVLRDRLRRPRQR